MTAPYQDRTHAGRMLAAALSHMAWRDDLLVLALPRGGVPVGYEVADALDAPLDCLPVRKLGVPGHEELAMGAIAPGGVRVLDQAVVDLLSISPEVIERVAQQEQAVLGHREKLYRGNLPRPDLQGRTVILVDDGLATGSTMRAAITALRPQRPARIIVAIPIAPKSSCTALAGIADEVICPLQPEPFYAIGQWYEEFSQVTDVQVIELLDRARRELSHRASRRTLRRTADGLDSEHKIAGT